MLRSIKLLRDFTGKKQCMKKAQRGAVDHFLCSISTQPSLLAWQPAGKPPLHTQALSADRALVVRDFWTCIPWAAAPWCFSPPLSSATVCSLSCRAVWGCCWPGCWVGSTVPEWWSSCPPILRNWEASGATSCART